MTEAQQLFVLLAVLYLVECTGWAHAHAYAFHSWLGESFKPVRPGRWFGNPDGGLLVRHLLPPLGTHFLAQWCPISFSRDAIVGYVPQAVGTVDRPNQSAQCWRRDDVEEVRVDGKYVLVNGERFVRCVGDPEARHYADRIRQWQTGGQPLELIARWLDESLDVDAIDSRWQEFVQRSAASRFFGNLLFCLLFVAGPFLVWQQGLLRAWVFLIIPLVPLVLGAVITFVRLHRFFVPDDRVDRILHAFVAAVYPLEACRAVDMVSRHVFTGYHPLAVACALCREDDFRDFGRRFLSDLHFPLQPVFHLEEPAARTVVEDFRELQIDACNRMLAREEIELGTLMTSWMPEEGSQTYCPRCQSQFVLETGLCSVCGIELLNWGEELG